MEIGDTYCEAMLNCNFSEKDLNNDREAFPEMKSTKIARGLGMVRAKLPRHCKQHFP